VTFKRVNDFATEDPAKLDRELAQLEDNITAEFVLVRKQLAPQLQVVSFTPASGRQIVAILPDQQLSVDTGQADAKVVFPPLLPANFGRRFALIKRMTANAVVTSCQDPLVTCNGAAFPSFGAGAVGLFVFHCDSSGYYR